jgi:hypothetical protein
MEGEGLIGLAFITALVVGLWRSKRRLQTALYIFLAVLIGCVTYIVLAYLVGISGYAGGYIGIDIGLLCGALVALVHSRKSRNNANVV